ncbi:MAG: PPC domain-containing protein, partial [Sulfurovum sp.]|nr:PPC domain-containing protein [Sulfurovum sp.]
TSGGTETASGGSTSGGTETASGGSTDDHGNSKDEATSISLQSTTEGRINGAGDVDWFKVVISRRGTLTVDTTGSTDTEGFLYNASGTKIASNDDSGSDRNFKILRSVVAGTYYVKVKHHNALLTGSYLLAAHFDDHGNSKDEAAPINPNGETLGSIEMAGDEDWFKVDITSAGTLTMGVASQTAGDISVSLYNASSSTSITSGDSSNTLGISQRLAAGTYYIKVKHHSATGTGNYKLATKFTLGSTTSGVPFGVPDDHNNSKDEATSIRLQSTTEGRINGAGDVDWFKVDITSAGTLTVDTTGTTDTYGELYNASGTKITSDDDSGSEHNFKISQYLETGTYYVKVKHRDSSAISGTYLLVAHFDDHGNSKDEAAPINLNSRTLGSIEMAGDEDWFKVDITSAGTLTMGVDSQTAGDINVSLYGESNVSIVSGDSSNTLGVSKRLAAGTYYVKVKHRSTTGTGDYRLVTRFTPSSTTSGVPSGETTDDDNIIDEATPINPNSTTQGRIEVDGDVDWFKIVIPRAGTFTVSTTGTTDTYGVLYDANGTEITSDDDSGSGHNFKISRSITVGTYYVTVRHRD